MSNKKNRSFRVRGFALAALSLGVGLVSAPGSAYAADAASPAISDIGVEVRQTFATITWRTDLPTTGVVDFGLSEAYTDSAWSSYLTTTHTVTLAGLAAESTYHFQITVESEFADIASSADRTLVTEFNGAPVIDVWHGPDQTFGDPGIAQRWVNILGTVTDVDGIRSLVYSLNGGTEYPLSRGPDTRRLLGEGDFNVEIDAADLYDGSNEVVITATDNTFATTVETVTVNYVLDAIWPPAYAIDWSTVADLQDVAQVVDGLWEVHDGKLRPEVLGYDRVVAVGADWLTDYEVTVPITMHSIDPAGYAWPSFSPGFGLTLRWPGHTAWDGAQPTWGWQPSGAGVWYDAGHDGPLSLGGEDGLSESDPDRFLDYNVTYIFKIRVQTIPDTGSFYAVKVWEQGQQEPTGWDLSGMEGLTDVPSGSCILIAHHVDVSFGNVTIVQLDSSGPPMIGNVTTEVTQDIVTIHWTTNKPATSTVNYGLSSAYTDTVSDPALSTSHAITLSELDPNTLYHFEIVSEDFAGNVSVSGDLTFTTTDGVTAGGIVSDDFRRGLNQQLWTFINPLGDATVSMSASQAQIVIPATGAVHDVWTNGNSVPRLMQTIDDIDFEVEAKFESALTEGFQSQGILIEQDPGSVVRAEFHHYGGSTNLFVATIFGTNATTRTYRSLSVSSPMYLRVKRTWDQWTITYSFDGASWTTAATFSQPMTVNMAGVFAGGGADTPHTATIDYFFDTAAPIVPEDPDIAALSVSVDGQGSVAIDPDLPLYLVGDTITVTALADPGWLFDYWSGDLAGDPNPTAMMLVGDVLVSAVFVPEDDLIAPAISDVAVTVDQTAATVTWTTDEPATSIVDFGLSTVYTDYVADLVLETAHSLSITGLDPGTLYHFEIVSQDASGNSGTSGDLTWLTDEAISLGVVSDDFDGPSLDLGVWTFVNPLGDASIVMTGSRVQIVIPATGELHDVWTNGNFLPRLMQSVDDIDFEVEAKFDSPLTSGFQSQGILIEQSPTDVVRIEFHHYGGQTKVFVATILDSTAKIRTLKTLAASEPMYLRVERIGDLWIVGYSFDGAGWITATTFTQPMTVSAVGVFAGNAADTPHTATIDYFYDASTVPVQEPTVSVLVGIAGEGSVGLNPDLTEFVPGEVVELTAAPSPGWFFDYWSGDLTGSDNPLTVTVAGEISATAVFTLEVDRDPPTITDLGVAVGQTTATVSWLTDEPATSVVDFGLTSSYTDSVWDLVLKTSHSLWITGLSPGTAYHFQIGSADLAGNLGTSGDLAWTTDSDVVPGIISDDFSGATLDTGMWTFINPLNDASIAMTGNQVQIVIPATGQTHDVWTDGNFLPRLMQPVDDIDFELEAKYESSLTTGFQSQGILVEQDADNVIRIEFHHYGGRTKVFVATLFGANAKIRALKQITLGTQMLLRVTRSGDWWTVSYSVDGVGWATATTFNQAMAVTSAGVFAGNAADTPHTATIDYFFDTASPIDPEDGIPVP